MAFPGDEAFPSYSGVPEGVDEQGGGPQFACPDCGREFNRSALDRHMKICKKVFVQKRKKFDSAASRLGDLENAGELVAQAHKLEKAAEKAKVQNQHAKEKADT